MLTLDKPPVNRRWGARWSIELTRAARELAADEDGRCLILRSAGKHFCGGADLKERRTMSVDDVRRFVPLLAGVQCAGGGALSGDRGDRGGGGGGGCEMALACDFRILAENVKIGLRETALAILPGGGGTQRLPRLIGPARAKRWIFAAEMHDAAQALADGVADRIAPVERLDAEARELAAKIAANGPVAVRLAKRAIDQGAHLALTEALDFEWECYQPTLDTADRVEALEAFAEKRPPRFRGR